MKVGDLVKFKSEYLGADSIGIGIIVSVGSGEEHTDTEQSCALHPDIWVLVDGNKVRWNHRAVEVFSESR